ncbi:MAG: ketose-bisphosphate aldolase, partial [Thermotogae bacterium]|nr:ketose-bisphosphate aldolase [Thermotogota bacterium]
RAGYTSVMIDASHMPFEENMAETKKIVEIAHAVGISVEAELGRLVGIEDNVKVSEREAVLVNPEEAEVFVEKTKVDFLAPAIGTSHGAFKFKGEPKLDFERLKEVKKRTGIPLVLHGASSVPQELIELANSYGAEIEGAKGIPTDMLKESVKYGINKVNTDTDLRMAFMSHLRKTLSEKKKEFDPRKLLKPSIEAIKEVVKERMRILGSAGKA